MIDKVDNMMAGLSAFADSLEAIVCNHFEENGDTLAQMNMDMLSRGLRPDGTEIDPWLSVQTDYEKRLRGDNPERPDRVPNLRNKGDFYGGIRLEIRNGNEIWMTSDDIKWEHDIGGRTPLRDVYGEVLGISDYDMEEMILPALNDELIERLMEAIGG